jgi:hypothetical protein
MVFRGQTRGRVSLVFSQGEHTPSAGHLRKANQKVKSRRCLAEHISQRRLMEIDKLLARTENLFWRAPKSGMLSAVVSSTCRCEILFPIWTPPWSFLTLGLMQFAQQIDPFARRMCVLLKCDRPPIVLAVRFPSTYSDLFKENRSMQTFAFLAFCNV